MGKLNGILNYRNYYGGQEAIRFNKACKIYKLTKWSNLRRVWYLEKYWTYSKNQPNLFICDNKAYSSDRHWNISRRLKQRKVNLLPWRKAEWLLKKN